MLEAGGASESKDGGPAGVGAVQAAGTQLVCLQPQPQRQHPNAPLRYKLYDPNTNEVVTVAMDDGTIDAALIEEPLQSLQSVVSLNDLLLRSVAFQAVATKALGTKAATTAVESAAAAAAAGDSAASVGSSKGGSPSSVLRSRENVMHALPPSKNGSECCTPAGELLHRMEDLMIPDCGGRCTALVRRELAPPHGLTVIVYGTSSSTLKAFPVDPSVASLGGDDGDGGDDDAASPPAAGPPADWFRVLIESTLDDALPDGWGGVGSDSGTGQGSRQQQQEEEEACRDLKAVGNAAFADKRFQEAQQAYEQALVVSPHHLTVRLNKAAALLEQGAADKCIQECQVVISQARALQAVVNKDEAGLCNSSSGAVEARSRRARRRTCPATDDDDKEEEDGGGKTSISECSHQLTDGKSIEFVVAKAYARMGNAYRKLGRHTRAVNAFLLSLKEQADPQVRASLTGTVHQLRASAMTAEDRQKQQQRGGRVQGAAAMATPDIEDMAARHQLMGYKETFRFNCTRCGECCRTSDYIMLGPYDLFLMTRSQGMKSLDVHTTTGLHRHPRFKEAFRYTLKDGAPVCYLRPIQNPAGHCHFAFPLYRDPTTGALLGHEEVVKLQEVQGGGDDTYTPVTRDEYNLTEEEEEEALKRLRDEEEEEEGEGGSSQGEDDDDDDDDCCKSCDHDQEEEEEEKQPEAVLNSYGRQALSCMFGKAHMPTMCASYPLANEQSWGDFWYTRSGGHGMAGEALAQQLEDGLLQQPPPQQRGGEGQAAAVLDGSRPPQPPPPPRWLSREKYVVVKTDGCEGFLPQEGHDDNNNDEEEEDGDSSYYSAAGGRRRRRRRTTTINAVDPPPAKQTVEQFLHSESDLSTRLAHADWFLHVFNKACHRMTAIGRVEGGVDPRVVKRCTAMLMRIWYDWDSLQTARRRPFKSFQRVQRVVESLTDCVINETDKFARRGGREAAAAAPWCLPAGARGDEHGGVGEEDKDSGREGEQVEEEDGEGDRQLSEYIELLSRLNI